jgi:hypothetical protein
MQPNNDKGWQVQADRKYKSVKSVFFERDVRFSAKEPGLFRTRARDTLSTSPSVAQMHCWP